MKKIMLSFLFIMSSIASTRGELQYQIMAQGFVDNRESGSVYCPSGTAFGDIATIALNINRDSIHQLSIGMRYIIEFGAPESFQRLKPLLWYRYKNGGAVFAFGSFPREIIGLYPEVLLSDSLNIFRPVVEGAFFEKQFKCGFRQNVWLDWTGRRSSKTREAFIVGFSADIKYHFFSSAYFLHYYHLARRVGGDDSEPIEDNGGLVIRTGLFKGNREDRRIDSVALYCDFITTFTRIRGESSWKTPVATQISAMASFGKFGIQAEYYRQLISDHALVDSYFGNHLYMEHDFALFTALFNPIRSENIKLNLQFDFITMKGKVSSRQRMGCIIIFRNDARDR